MAQLQVGFASGPLSGHTFIALSEDGAWKLLDCLCRAAHSLTFELKRTANDEGIMVVSLQGAFCAFSVGDGTVRILGVEGDANLNAQKFAEVVDERWGLAFFVPASSFRPFDSVRTTVMDVLQGRPALRSFDVEQSVLCLDLDPSDYDSSEKVVERSRRLGVRVLPNG